MDQIPGLLAIAPPKRAARGREDETLLFYLTLSGNSQFTPAEYKQITDKATQRYYKTAGSLTSAIRAAAGELNQALLNRNLHTTAKGEYIIGRLILGALHGAQFVFAQCGPTHVFQLTAGETRQVHDGQIAGRGLGVGQATPLYFSQLDLHHNDLLVMCPNLPAGWEAVLLGLRTISIETLRRSLASNISDDANAVLVQARTGRGCLNILPGRQSVQSAPAAVPAASGALAEAVPAGISLPAQASGADQAAAPARQSSQVESSRPANRFTHLMSGEAKQATSPANVPSQSTSAGVPTAGQPVSTPAAQPARRPFSNPIVSVSPPVKRPGRFAFTRNSGDIPEIKRPPSRQRREIFGGLARLIQGTRLGTHKVSEGAHRFLPNLLPKPEEENGMGGSGMAFFAIVIPVIIVAIAAMVYFQYGRTEQYKQNYEMAVAQAAQARGLTNPTDVRHAWDSTIYYLDLADKSQKPQESINLRQEAQTALDNLDGIMRLDFRAGIIGGLDRSVQISHMAATNTDLYMLDAARGGILRATLTNQGYEVDPTFKCEPGLYDTTVVGALVDLVTLPSTNFYNANILAMDSKGNLLYCGVAKPAAVTLVPPQLGWRSIDAFSLDSDGNNLYVLDPGGNAVWQYSGNASQFTDLPAMYFGEQVPQNMNTAMDLAINASDLYLLFQDGHVTSCPLTRLDVSPMHCADPATFVDTRPERQPGPRINDAIFTQMSFASIPDPSLYMLEPLTRAIYRFSPRPNSLELRGEFRASMEQTNTLFNGPATAMTIGPNRYIFFSVGNQVYFATDVP